MEQVPTGEVGPREAAAMFAEAAVGVQLVLGRWAVGRARELAGEGGETTRGVVRGPARTRSGAALAAVLVQKARAVGVGRAELAGVRRARPAEDGQVLGEFAWAEEVDQRNGGELVDGQAEVEASAVDPTKVGGVEQDSRAEQSLEGAAVVG